ncbi:hypothetical protein UFOVP32_59 [uncultured Caudovirales phage]|uniref:Uncharacterized protein n=1 Tax=uncultured Caudovirales phage TaxID=2100421 RepID=A0A6J5KTN3_9CAUD|nr:hypothetical protein UFOVP32_59 [uncultured Caudovirales phage]CAB4123579.1 hypothetical protein UFOVP50_17 [uncultured Caudovirales phage]
MGIKPDERNFRDADLLRETAQILQGIRSDFAARAKLGETSYADNAFDEVDGYFIDMINTIEGYASESRENALSDAEGEWADMTRKQRSEDQCGYF